MDRPQFQFQSVSFEWAVHMWSSQAGEPTLYRRLMGQEIGGSSLWRFSWPRLVMSDRMMVSRVPPSLVLGGPSFDGP